MYFNKEIAYLIKKFRNRRSFASFAGDTWRDCARVTGSSQLCVARATFSAVTVDFDGDAVACQ